MPHPFLSLPRYSPVFFLVDENPNDSPALSRALALTVPGLRLRQASTEREFEQGLSLIETPALGMIDWSVSFGDALGLLRRARERWPKMPWIVFGRTDPNEIRTILARAEIPGPTPTVVPEFAVLAKVVQEIATGLRPTETDAQSWGEMWNEVPFGVALVSKRDRLIHYANPVLALWVGVAPAGLVGKKLNQLHPGLQASRLGSWLDQPVDSETPLQVEVSFNRTGQIRFADALLAPPGLSPSDYRCIFYVDASERRSMERKWRRLAETVFQTGSGEEFFNTLVLGLCNVLEVDMAAVAMLLPGEPQRAQIVAMCDRGALIDGFEINMSGNPCAEVLKHQFLCITRRVGRSFPAAEWLINRKAESYLGLPLFDQTDQPIGVLEVMHRQPLRKTRDLRAVMQVFAGRAASELERLCTETARRQTEAGLAHTQRLAHIGSWEIDAATNRLSWSDETYRIFGVERAEFTPTIDQCLALVHRDDRSRVEQVLKNALAGRGFTRLTHRVVRPDGTTRHLECEGELMLTPAGLPAVLRGTTLDITDRVAAELELRRLALVAQETDHAVILFDEHRRIQWVNAGFTSLTGYDSREALGQTGELFMTKPETLLIEGSPLSESWWREDRNSIEISCHDKFGEEYWAQYSFQSLRDADGRVTGHFGLGKDITFRKVTRAALQLVTAGIGNQH